MASAPKILELPPKLKTLYDFLDGQGDTDILAIYRAVIAQEERVELRDAQQNLGPYITRLNRRLREHRKVVKPGRLKGTYCLTTL